MYLKGPEIAPLYKVRPRPWPPPRNCHSCIGSIYQRDVIFSLSRSSTVNLSSVLGILPTPAPRLDLTFPSQFWACLIHGSAYHCPTVHCILHPRPRKLPRPCVPHPQNQGRPNSVGLPRDGWQAESRIPPRIRETTLEKDPQEILRHIKSDHKLYKGITTQWPQLPLHPFHRKQTSNQNKV